MMLTLILVVFVSGCKEDNFQPNVGVCPQIRSTIPATAAVGVPLNQVISATFSEKMNPTTITTSTFTVIDATKSAQLKAATVGGTISYSEKTASFTPTTPFSPNTTYTARLTTAIRDVVGSNLQVDYVWTFTTGVQPTVVSVDPVQSAVGVILNKVVVATFSVPMDPVTINSSTFNLKQGNTLLASTVTYNGTAATLTTTGNLVPNTVYTGTITGGVKNLNGIAMANDYVWTFSTGISPTILSSDPANNAIGIELNKIVVATFSVPMDPATFTPATFTLNQGTNVIAGTISYTGSTVSFTPAIALTPNTIYTGKITTAIKSAAGIPLAADYQWSFTTGLSPTVISSSPLDLENGVSLNKVVTATFSVPMDPLTLTGTTYTLNQGTIPVLGTVTYLGSTATFTPSVALNPNTIYTATITTGVKNVAGIPLSVKHVWAFTTSALLAPTVISTDPLNNASGVALNKVVTATFSVPMDLQTVTATTYTLKQGTNSIVGTVSYLGSTATFTPASPLVANTLYTGTITTGVKNTAGISLVNNYVWSFTTQATLPVSPVVDLKSAARFAILSGVGISNDAGFSVINNLDVGIYPGVRSSVTGFPPAIVVGGAIYAADDITPAGTPAMLAQAKLDLVAAYLYAEGATAPAPATVSGDQGGKTLAPGIYKSTSTLLIQAGNLTLDGQGDPNATWIFQVASAFTTVGGAGGNIILTGGAQTKNIFWQTGSSAVIGDNTTFYGNVLALQSITMNSHATAVGRMLAQNGAVTLTHTNTISKP